MSVGIIRYFDGKLSGIEENFADSEAFGAGVDVKTIGEFVGLHGSDGECIFVECHVGNSTHALLVIVHHSLDHTSELVGQLN